MTISVVGGSVTRGAVTHSVRSATVLGLGGHLPDQIVPNAPIAERIGVDDDWIVRRTGIQSRRCAAADERLTDLATRASRNALLVAGVDPAQLDLVLVATMSQDELTPNAAPLVAHALRADRAGAMDIGAACTGFLSALAVGSGQIEAGRADRVLVVGAEVMTRLIDPYDRRTAALFGDGAGALVLGAAGVDVPGCIGPIMLAADGSQAGTIAASHADRFIRMDGHETFRHAVKRLVDGTVTSVARAGLELDDIDLFVYHQANARILRAVGEQLDLPAAKMADYIAEMGNTSAASIPLALTALAADGRLRAGHRVLLAAVGAGFTWGAGVVDWGLSL